MKSDLTRRRLLLAGLSGAGAALLSGCDRLSQSETVNGWLNQTENLTRHTQRFLGQQRLAPEFSEADISPVFRVNGTSMPDSEEYAGLLSNGFRDWRLRVSGLVNQPLSLSLSDLQRFPSRIQITRHDCVEGWSAIGKWQGVPLGLVLDAARLRPGARYVVFICADELEQTLDGSGRYYESIDLQDAFHPQTLLAYRMNDQPLSVGHGAPLRLRVERQLGYKHAKYLMEIKVTDSYASLWGGRGGYWEDRGYEWYGGI